MKRLLGLMGCWLLFGTLPPVHAQALEEFGTEMQAPQHLIDMPTAAVLAKGTASMALRAYSGGGLLGGINVGVSDRLLLGISFGGTNIIGTGGVDWNPRPEVAIKYLLIRQGESAPGVSIGFESQGYGPYDDDLNRYQIKSRGFYGVMSRNFALAGVLGLHGGINYSLENDDGDGNVSVFFGAEKSINEHLTALVDYDVAANDNKGLAGYGRKRGYFNVGGRITLGGQVGIEFDLRNLFDNRVDSDAPSRELKILYTETFSF